MGKGVVVTGVGVLTSIGTGIEEFTTALRIGRCGITSSNQDDLGIAGRIQEFKFDARLAALELSEETHMRARLAGRRAPRSAQISIITALEAWQQAFGDSEAYRPEEIDILVAGNNIGQGYQYDMREKFKTYPEYVPASYALHFMDTDQIGLLSEIIGIRGQGLTVGAASASGNMVIIQACRHIKSGSSKACVVVGAMADLSPLELHSFRQIGALGGGRFAELPHQACRPFDTDREGFIYGQGCACLILESAANALNRGATLLGQIAGAGACLDGNRSTDPSVDGEARCMQLALQDAACEPHRVEYVNAHATSSILGDMAEVKALKQVFGSYLTNLQINATKGLTGHCLFAAGVVETVATLIQMQDSFLHPNLNLEHPIDDQCRFVGATAGFYGFNLALNNAFGFGGINTSIVLKKPH